MNDVVTHVKPIEDNDATIQAQLRAAYDHGGKAILKNFIAKMDRDGTKAQKTRWYTRR